MSGNGNGNNLEKRKETILVTGATGMIGKRLVAALLEDGHAVNVVSRDPDAARRALGGGVSAFEWNAPDEPLPERALAHVSAVVHLAGEPIAARRWSTAQKKKILDSRVTGTRRVVEAIARMPQKPRVLVSASACGIYGNRGDETLTEDSMQGSGFLAEVCKEWEAASAPAATLGVRVVNPRIGVVIGPEGGALAKMRPIFKAGAGASLGSGAQWFPWIHVDDVVGLVRAALRDPRYQGPVNAAAPGAVTNREFTRVYASSLRRPAIAPPVPPFALKLMFGEMGGMLLEGQRVLPAKASELGYAFAFPTLAPALTAA